MPQEKILLVDDQPENISLLYAFLHQFGYELLAAQEGQTALQIAEQNFPDLVLLDIMMPGINGFEVCRKIKSNPALSHVPVIFMSALTETHDKLEGFAVGGVDYITKPFQQDEVLARIRAQLTIFRQHNELEQKNYELDAFAHTVAHDLKNPLGEIINQAELIELEGRDKNHDKIEKLAHGIHKSVNKVSDIIESLLLLAGTSRHRDILLEPFDMGYVIANVQERMALQLKNANVTLQMPDKWPFVSGYPAWVEEIWSNYISNAIKYGGQPPRIELGYDAREDSVRFWVKDNGPGLSQEQIPQLFVPFTRLHRDRAEGHGLGLSIVQRIAEKLNGHVGVESQLNQGSLFYFILPYKTPITKEEDDFLKGLNQNL
jgi:signal transduction histidine kinase